MSELFRPFSGFIPDSAHGSRVVGPPSATISAEQKQAAANDPLSFRFIAGRKARTTNDQAMDWLGDCEDDGVLRAVSDSAVVYRQTSGQHTATGLLADLSLDAYASGHVKPHEKTIAKAQQKMAQYMQKTRVYGNPAVTTIPDDGSLSRALNAHARGEPDSKFTTVDGNHHEMWVATGAEARELCASITGDIYITDGHHRLAAASAVARDENRSDSSILAGVFPTSEVTLRAFARCIFDTALDSEAAIEKLREAAEVVEVPSEDAWPRSRFEFGASIGDQHFRVRIRQDQIPDDHHQGLNINLLQNLILAPVFGITQPRLDERLGFTANVAGLTQPCPGADAWFLPFHLEATDVIEVADAGQTMPPKSTWFEPKLPSGLAIRPID